MKKEYIKPEMLVHQISRMSMLVGSVKGVYGKIEGVPEDQQALKYGGYIDEEEEENYDPD